MSTPTILFCWEYGAGLGHVSSLKIIAGHLKSLGMRSVLANPDGIPVSGNFAPFDEVIDFPNAKQLHDLTLPEGQGIVSYNATIKGFGYDDPRFLFTRLKLWQRLFEERSPAMVIGDYAPTAIITARSTGIPTVATGNGYTLPPANIKTYPRFANQSDPVHGEKLLACINHALTLSKFANIPHLPAVFKSDIHACFTDPDLDPFKKHRQPKALGPLFGGKLPEPAPLRGERIFMYLTHCRETTHELVLSAAMSLDQPVDIYSLQANDTHRDRFENSKVTILDDPVPIGDICKNYRLAIHLGGHGLAMELLYSGMPQLLLPIDMEKILLAQILENHGLAHQLRVDHQKPQELIIHKIKQALSDERQKVSIDAHALKQKSENRPDSLDVLAEQISRKFFQETPD